MNDKTKILDLTVEDKLYADDLIISRIRRHHIEFIIDHPFDKAEKIRMTKSQYKILLDEIDKYDKYQLMDFKKTPREFEGIPVEIIPDSTDDK